MTEASGGIQKLQLSQQVSETLRRKILDGTFPPGTWLRQDHVARELGVSVIPVREAFKQLAAQGLVEHVPYRGIRVVQLTADELEDLYAVRAAAEGRAAFFAATHLTSEEMKTLEQLCREMEACDSPESLPQYRNLNRAFHLLIVRGSRRPYLIRLLEHLWSSFPSMLWSNYPEVAEHSLPDRAAADNEEHRLIVAALLRRDARAAQEAAEHHIQRAGRELAQFVRSCQAAAGDEATVETVGSGQGRTRATVSP